MHTRSTISSSSYSNNENLMPVAGKGSHMGDKNSKLGETKKPSRTALGDISNKVPKSSFAQQGDNTNKAQAPGSSEQMKKKTRTLDVNKRGDVSMRDDNTFLAASVQDLSLLQNVDAEDASNPLYVTDYINAIMAHLRETEGARCASPNYMQERQNDINPKMREILIDWLVEVHLKFKLQPETLFLTVNLIDRFLEKRQVARTKLQLVGCTAMLIASKYEEIYAPEVRDFVYISDKAYSRDEILSMESIMLNTLGFHCTSPSALRFCERFSKVAGCTKQHDHLVKYLVELQLQEFKFLKFLPSTIAASAMYVSNEMLSLPAWSTLLEAHTKKSVEDIRDCVTELKALAAHEPAKYKAVRKKYTHKRFSAVATIKVNGAIPYKK